METRPTSAILTHPHEGKRGAQKEACLRLSAVTPLPTARPVKEGGSAAGAPVPARHSGAVCRPHLGASSSLSPSEPRPRTQQCLTAVTSVLQTGRPPARGNVGMHRSARSSRWLFLPCFALWAFRSTPLGGRHRGSRLCGKDCVGKRDIAWEDKTVTPGSRLARAQSWNIAYLFIESRDGGSPSFLVALGVPRNPEFSCKLENKVADKNRHTEETSDSFCRVKGSVNSAEAESVFTVTFCSRGVRVGAVCFPTS